MSSESILMQHKDFGTLNFTTQENSRCGNQILSRTKQRTDDENKKCIIEKQLENC